MSMETNKSKELTDLIVQLEADRAWLLLQLDQGRWPELRMDLAALERELGQLLTRTSDALEES